MKTLNNFFQSLCKNLKTVFYVFIAASLIITINSCSKDDNTDTPEDKTPDTDTSYTYSLSDCYGTWKRHSIITSSSNNGFWIYGTIINSSASSAVNLTLPFGNWDTTYTAMNPSMASNGVLTISNDPFSHTYMSYGKNLMVGTTKRDDSYTLVFDQRTSTSTTYSLADFEGRWYSHYIAGGGSWNGWVHATSDIDNSGNCVVSDVVKSDVNGNVGNSAFNISSDGTITVPGVPTYNGFMSTDKSLMIANMTDGGGGGGIAIAQKAISGTTYSIADLKGTWQLHDIIVGSENWTEHGLITIDNSGVGTLSNMIRDDNNTFNYLGAIPISITADGIVTFDPDFHGFMSADKKLVVATKGDAANAYSLVIIQKMP